MRRLAAGRGPIAVGRHDLDHLLAGHRLSLFGEDLCRRVQATQLAVLALSLGLLPFCLSLRLCLGLAAFAHNSPPFTMDSCHLQAGPTSDQQDTATSACEGSSRQ